MKTPLRPCRGLNLFEVFVGIGQPYFVDIIGRGGCRNTVIKSVALQYPMTFERILYGYKRFIGVLGFADKEDQRFFSYNLLVVIHCSYTVVQNFAFAEKFAGRFGNDTDEVVLIFKLKRQVFVGD